MEVIIENLFHQQFSICSVEFQEKFRKIYQQLKAVDNPQEVKGITKIAKGLYKITIQSSKISLQVKSGKAHIGLFLFNEYYFDNED